MTNGILIAAVLAVGVLHTLVPDHWAPIVVIARQQGWSVQRTIRAAAIAGLGHVTSTLALGVVLWAAGATLAARYAHAVNLTAAAALVAFGVWIAWSGWREARESGAEAGDLRGHAHLHTHGTVTHVHWHQHEEREWHAVTSGVAVMHEHDHVVAGRTALLLILGSSPMFEGIPAFFAASTRGVGLLVTMAIVFAVSTVATYVATCAFGIASLQRMSLGAVERYGELLSGCVVAAVGVYALLTA